MISSYHSIVNNKISLIYYKLTSAFTIIAINAFNVNHKYDLNVM